MKELNIGLVGYGFMGRTHSNAFLQAPRFFDLPVKPVLKAICARNADRAKAFAANWGYESIETDWRKLVERKDIDLIDIASTNDTHHDIAIAAAKAGKMVMCEKPLGRTAAEAQGDGRRGRSGQGAEHGLVQLPPRAGCRAASSSCSTKASSDASSTTAPSSCRTGRSPRICRRAAKACGGSTSRSPAAASPAICSRTASTPRCG